MIGSVRARKYRFEVVFEKEEEGGYHAYCPDLPGCHTWGRTLNQAKKHVREAVSVYCESLLMNGENVPRSRSQKVITHQMNISVKAA